MNKHKLWVEKHRPSKIDEYIFHDDAIRKPIMKMIDDKTIPHLLFSGTQGSGKTTLAFILINELDMDPTDVLTINASDKQGGVDYMRDEIKSFITTHSFGDFKIVHLEEADYLTPNGQAVLRRMMEEYSDFSRFILTCNYDNKIIPAIHSRCQHFHFRKPDFDEVLEYVYTILKKERVKTDFDTLERYVTVGFPDIRKIINLVQQNTINRILVLGETNSSDDWKNELLELIGKDDWEEARKIACKNVDNNEWEDVFKFLYENLSKSKKFKDTKNWERGITIIAEHLYKHALVAIPEINGAAMFIGLSLI
jgi:DNA polymerase III delta prime subunit